MSLDADHIVDRRRMRRKLTFWRVLAVVIAIVAIGAAAVALGTRGLGSAGGAQIARVTIRGLIRGDQERVEALAALAKARNARAVIVHVDSPGGTTAGSEQLYNALRLMSREQADGGRGRRPGGVGRLHRRHGVRPHRRPGHVAGRLGRRAVPVSQLHRPPEDRRRPGRDRAGRRRSRPRPTGSSRPARRPARRSTPS